MVSLVFVAVWYMNSLVTVVAWNDSPGPRRRLVHGSPRRRRRMEWFLWSPSPFGSSGLRRRLHMNSLVPAVVGKFSPGFVAVTGSSGLRRAQEGGLTCTCLASPLTLFYGRGRSIA
jgi:hypothetical protein